MTVAALALTPDGGAALVLARAAATASLLSLFGALLFLLVIAPAAFAAAPPHAAALKRRVSTIALASALAATVLSAVWLVVQSMDLAEAHTLPAILHATVTVLRRTHFGHVTAGQVLLSAAAALALFAMPKAGAKAATAAAGLGVLLHVGHSHAYAMGARPLMAVNAVHVLAAAAWLGALLPLLVTVQTAPPHAAYAAARRFSPLGQVCVGLLALTAAWQATIMVGSLAGLIGTAYGRLALLKLALFALLLVFAALNRTRLVPALRPPHPTGHPTGHPPTGHPTARRALLRSLALETAAALAIVIAAALLSQLEPAMHLQPWWPLAQRLSLDPVREDPDIRREVLTAAAIVLLPLVALIAAAVSRRPRLAATAALALVAAAVWSAPHLGVLLVPASPTSFYRSPTGFSAAAILTGQSLYAANCTACHGPTGAGDGPAAAALPVPPADLTAAHLWMHSDGELFGWLTNGIAAPGNRQAMPGFAATIDEPGRWALIDYLRAHNAGLAAHATGSWPRPVAAPDLALTCAARPTTLAAERGRFIRLAFTPPLPPPDAAAETCLADAAQAEAYAIASGASRSQVLRMEFLIDAHGLLRAMQPRGAQNGWDDAGRLAALIARLRATAPAPPSDETEMAMPPGMKM